MLAFDLETLGPDVSIHDVTCAAVYDPDMGIERYFIFKPPRDDPEEFMLLLDHADRLCAFNGARFDIPLIVRCFKPAHDRVERWRLKLHDVFEACKLALDITFPLQALLELNNIPGKTGSGHDAVQMALNGQLEDLGAYCLNDTKRTHQVSSLPRILLPKTRNMVMDPLGRFHAASCPVLDLSRVFQ